MLRSCRSVSVAKYSCRRSISRWTNSRRRSICAWCQAIRRNAQSAVLSSVMRQDSSPAATLDPEASSISFRMSMSSNGATIFYALLLVLHRRRAIRANGIVKVVVHLAASPEHLKLLFANPAGVDSEFGVADVVELDAVCESVGNVPDYLPAVFLVIAGTQHHRKFALVACGQIGRPCVDDIEAIQVDEFTAFRQHPHRVSPSSRVLRGPCRWDIMTARPSDLPGCGDRSRILVRGRFRF